MIKLKLFSSLLAVILLFQQPAYADTFIVTSNADSGPGTLRDAITMAGINGTTGKDYIYFNIADLSETGRTITLHSPLTLTSKIAIDASAQPGNKFGVSDSRIKIIHDGSANFSQGIILPDVEDIEIYSLYFSDFFSGLPTTLEIRCAIFIPGFVRNIKIGAPGKGNVFYNNAISIANRYHWGSNPGDRFADAEIRSNFFGLSTDGTTANPFGDIAFMVKSFRNLTLGGNTEAEGNRFAGNTEPLMILSCDSINNNGYLKILYNTFGCDYSKTIPIKCGSVSITSAFLSGPAQLPDLAVTVSKNTFNNPAYSPSNSCTGLLSINEIGGFITITGNKMGNLVGININSCQMTGIGIGNCENGMIGGPNPEDQNTISYNYTYGISLYNNRNITIQKNSLFCNSQGIRAVSTKVAIPEVKIMGENGTDNITGTATPNCKIELFQSPQQCSGCNNGDIYMGETMSDNNGNWSFTGSYTSAVTARATTVNGVTGEFSIPAYTANPNVQHPICNQNNGYIKGMQLISGTKYYWIKNYTDTIFNQQDLTNIGAGVYEFVVEQTKYCTVNYRIILTDNSPVINEQGIIVVQPSCGLSNGSIINNISLSGIFNNIFWIDEHRDTIAHTANLANAGEGKYKLIVWNTAYGCADSTDWFVLANQSGPTLDVNNNQITPATCENANGSIKNITATNFTGTPFIQWVDSLNNPVGYSLDLINVPPGKYKLKFIDQGGCDTIITPFYIVPAIGRITIDSSQLKIHPAGCTVANGYLTGLSLTNTDLIVWQGLPANYNTADIYNLNAGQYKLTASNAYGCTAEAKFTIPTNAFQLIVPGTYDFAHSTCGNNNGFITIKTFNLNDPAYYTFKWIKLETREVAGTGISLNNLTPGRYELNVTDTNGCSGTVFGIQIFDFISPIINASAIKITPDQCSTKKGSITGMIVSVSRGPVTTYWIDENNTIVSNTQELLNAGAGKYQLVAKDNDCVSISDWFTIPNNTIGTTPQYDNLTIGRFTTAELKVKNPVTGTYFLYNDAAATQLIDQNSSGTFKTQILPNDVTYYIQHKNGSCISPVVPVKITVIDKSEFAIASAFTPNDDGLNDRLQLQVLGIIDVEYFKIYNRNGEEFFSTKTIGDGWDGRIKGAPQPNGVFVWIAKGKDINGNIITDKGSFVLIR